jgi:5'-nucleotidase
MAVSLLPDDKGVFGLEFAAAFVANLAGRILADGLPRGVTLNINIPSPPVKGVRVTKLGQNFYSPEIIEKKDPRGAAYFWIGTGNPRPVGDASTDVHAVRRGYISLTPLQADLTHYRALGRPFIKRLVRNVLPR